MIGATRRIAKQKLKGNWKVAIFSLVLISVLSVILNQVISGIAGGGTLFSLFSSVSDGRFTGTEYDYTSQGSAAIFTGLMSILVGLLTSILTVGYSWGLLDMVDGDKLSIESMFQTFSRERVWKVLGLTLLTGLFVFLWSLLFIIPGIIKQYSYSQALNILKDDPDISVSEAIAESRRMMDGYKWTYFLLDLSFSIWYIVPLFAYLFYFISSLLGIFNSLDMYAYTGYTAIWEVLLGLLLLSLLLLLYVIVVALYLEPYRNTARQVFYRSLTGDPENDYQDTSEVSDSEIDSFDELDF